MRSSKPPVLATWLLEHLVVGGRNEALEGDLREEFKRRRSVLWYWRQALGVILASLSNELCSHWLTLVLELAFLWVWSYYSLFYLLPSLRQRLWPMAFEPHARILWWMLVGYGEALMLVPVALTIYLVVRNFNLWAFACGLCVGKLAIFPVAFALGRLMAAYLVAHNPWPWWDGRMMAWYGALVSSIPVVAAVWAAQLIKRRSQVGKIPG